jgi:hypothetical protein
MREIAKSSQGGIIALPQLAVHLTAVTDARYDYDPSGVVNFVNDSIIPGANTERLETGQLLRSGRAGLLGEGHESGGNAIEQHLGQSVEITLRGALDFNAIRGHARGERRSSSLAFPEQRRGDR